MLWDVFISHASEDKDMVARPLARQLEAFGLRVGFDETQLSATLIEILYGFARFGGQPPGRVRADARERRDVRR